MTHNPDNTGHGHVFSRPDGVKARCGGPGMCKLCNDDLAAQRAGHGPQPGRTMRPTENLRFVERSEDQGDGTARRVRVLQQAWAPVYGGPCEWRDVPVVQDDSPAPRKEAFDHDAFTDALMRAMDARGVTQKQVAEATGVSETTLSRMRTGRHPDAASLAALSAWAGINPGRFMRHA